jgi:hypothetical protein
MTTPALPGKPVARPANNTTRLLLIAVVAVIVFGLVRGIFSHHDTAYEKIAGDMTVALQNNDLPAVEKFQNAETATHVTHGVVGHAADVFAPLGKLVRVRDTSSAGEVHQFDATFVNGVVHETIQFDPDNKVVHFKFDPPTQQK